MAGYWGAWERLAWASRASLSSGLRFHASRPGGLPLALGSPRGKSPRRPRFTSSDSSRKMRAAVGLFLPIAAAILGCWWWLGAPVAMPPPPLEAGEKLFCVSYTPFRGNQTPLDLATRIDASEIEHDLVRLARLSGCVRAYSTDFGLDRLAEIAQRPGMQGIQGAWIGRAPQRNRRQVQTATAPPNPLPATLHPLPLSH